MPAARKNRGTRTSSVASVAGTSRRKTGCIDARAMTPRPRPATSPRITGLSPSTTTIRLMWAASAPSARRTPNSRVRSETMCDSTP